jgi:lipoprotein-anchoring transpeptidase ErfK/SrfK
MPAPHSALTQRIRLNRQPPARPPQPHAPQRPPARPQPRRSNWWWLFVPVILLSVLVFSTCAALTLGVSIIYGSGILPSVSAVGVHLGGKSIDEAAAALQNEWTSLTLRDGERTWIFDPALLGITLDAQATAAQAYAQGRSAGSAVNALIGGVDVAPVLNLDIVTAAVTLEELAPRFEIEAINAGIRLENGTPVATPPQTGRKLDVAQMVGRLENDFEAEIADGVLDLPMREIIPTVTDATPLLALVNDLLTRPLQIMAFDPIANQKLNWSLPPEQWSQWLTASADLQSLALEESALRHYLESQASALGGAQYVELAAATEAIQTGLARRDLQASVRLYHHDRQHVVQPGETITSIAWDYGVPYPWLQRANPGVGDALNIGQSITVPSADNFLEYPVVPNKRIVVSISQQRTQVFENDQLKWDWPTSTGINSSPTWPGIYQVISHVPNAYAANWNLYMPNFMGVYRPVPGQDFTNGFHGFPTRGGSQLLWTNSLGTRVTYGCILISSTNAQALYNWAEDGVVVEIRP